MTYVVTDKCVRCKYTDCVVVCPVDCFHEGANMLVIDPIECIDCGVCVPECPVNAIYDEFDLPDDQRQFLAINAKYAPKWPVIDILIAPPADAGDWDEVEDKYAKYFDPASGTGERD